MTRDLVLGVASMVFGCTVFSIYACGDTNDGNDGAMTGRTGKTSQLLYEYSPGYTKWPNGVVPTCWDASWTSQPDFAQYSAQFRKWVKEEYELAAKLRFTGWGACPSNVNGMLKITYGTCCNSQRGYNPNGPTVTTLDTLANKPPADRKSYVLHEFGHVLGFDHEFNRPDTDGCAGAPPWDPGIYYTDYDPNSVMNATYCHHNEHLSAWDIVGLQRVYGRRPAGALVGLMGHCLDAPMPGGIPPVTGQQLEVYECKGSANQTWGYAYDYQLHPPSYSQQYADVQGANPADRTPVIGYTPQNPAGANQQWSFSGVEIRGMGALCLTATSFTIGQGLTLESCVGGGSSGQTWSIEFVGFSGSGPYVPNWRLRSSENTARCAAAPTGTGQLTLNACDSTNSQRFLLTNGGELRTLSNTCADIQGGKPIPGSVVRGATCLGTWDYVNNWPEVNQKWWFRGPVKGLAGKCLDIYQAVGANRQPVIIYHCTGGENQRWDYHFLIELA